MSQVHLEWDIDIAFSKNQKKKVTEKKFKISLKIEFLLKMKFLVISGHFRLDFLHQKIVSSL